MEVDRYFRPYKVKHLSFSNVLHNLFLTRMLVAAQMWASSKAGLKLVSVRTCYELRSLPGRMDIVDREESGSVRVIPDAWLLFERIGSGRGKLPVLLEIDRGTAYQANFKEHVKARIRYIKKDGAYSQLFGTEAVVVAM